MDIPKQVAEAMRTLGFDPEQTKAVIITQDSTVAISAEYPEPVKAPEGTNTDGK